MFASRTIDFSDGLSGSPSDVITFTHPDLGDFVITCTAAGSTETVFTSQAANIRVTAGHTNTDILTGIAVRTLINTIPDYSATDNGAGLVTITALSAGPHYNIVIADTVDTQTLLGRLLKEIILHQALVGQLTNLLLFRSELLLLSCSHLYH